MIVMLPGQKRVPKPFVVRYWLAILIAALLAVTPWMTGRFSLRTLLIVMTLVAVGMGPAIYAARN